MQTSSHSLRIYADSLSGASNAVLALIRINKIPAEIKEVGTVMKDDNLKEEYKKISPLGIVPALDDNGFILYGSHAILRYLCTTKRVSKNWYPEDPKRKGLIDSYLEWHDTYTKKCSLYFMTYYAHVMPRTYFTFDVAEQKMIVLMALDGLEKVYLKDTKYITSNEELSIADLVAVCEIVPIRATKINFDDFPKVKSWLDECMKQPEILKSNKGPLLLIEKAVSRLHL